MDEKKSRAKGSVCERSGMKSENFPEYDRRGGRECVFDEVMEQKRRKSQATPLSKWGF
jgi:hypothetical protein